MTLSPDPHTQETRVAGPQPALRAAVDLLYLVRLSPHSPEDHAYLSNVIGTLEGLEVLMRCIVRRGEQDPLFQDLYTVWRQVFRERRKLAGYSSVEALAETLGIAAGTLKGMESGKAPPTAATMRLLLLHSTLGLDQQDPFVQIVLNR